MPEEKILVVDDVLEIRRLLARLCQREGYAVSMAQDGETAIAMLESESFDIAIVDLVLPGIDGVAVLKHIRQKAPLTDVIILTGYGELETAATTLQMGAYYYLQKESFNLNLIPLVIGRMLEHQRLARANEELIDDLREANRELEYSKEQQLHSIQHIARAMVGGLEVEDMVVVLAQAMASVIHCDGAGVLMLAQELTEHPIAVIVGQDPLAPSDEQALIAAMIADADVSLEDEPEKLVLVGGSQDAQEERGWTHWESIPLVTRDILLGMAIIGRHDDEPFDEHDSDVLRILSAQGSVALENTYLFTRMRDLATRDSLTGLYNHGHFFDLLETELSRSGRQDHQLAVIMIDIDKDPKHGLKAVNDSLGHLAGDALLRGMAQRLRGNLRRADSLARYGGDEFVVLAPEVNQEQAQALAQRLWQKIREEPFMVDCHQVNLTASLGVAVSSPGANETSERMIQLADQACYRAKERGRDKVCLAWE